MKSFYTDIDECLVNNGGCAFSCMNLVGIDGPPDVNGNTSMGMGNTGLGYQCGCDTGFQLAGNNHDCIGMYIINLLNYLEH